MLPPTVIGPVLWVDVIGVIGEVGIKIKLDGLTYPVIELFVIDLLPEELLEIILVEPVIVLLPVPIYLLPEELLETILVVGVVRFPITDSTPSWVLSVPYELFLYHEGACLRLRC